MENFETKLPNIELMSAEADKGCKYEAAETGRKRCSRYVGVDA